MQKFIFSILLSLLLLGCSGGGGGSAGGNNVGAGGTQGTAPVVSGTVSTGGVFVGVVNVYGSNGASVEAVIIDASGNYSATVSGLTPPFLLCAVPDNPALATLCSWASEPGIANITQMTSLALYYANGEKDPVSLVGTWQTDYQSVSDNLPNAQAVVNANFVGVFDLIDPALNIDFSTYNFFTSIFSIGDIYDRILALLEVDLGSKPPIVLVDNISFSFNPNTDTSGINIDGTTGGGTTGGGTTGGGSMGIGSLTISGVDTPVIGTSFMPVISGASIAQDKVFVAWQNLDDSSLLSVQSDAGQIAYLIYAYGDVVQGTLAIPVNSYVNLIGCTGVVIVNCDNIILDVDTKTLILNNVQLIVPLQIGVSNMSTGSIFVDGTLNWE